VPFFIAVEQSPFDCLPLRVTKDPFPGAFAPSALDDSVTRPRDGAVLHVRIPFLQAVLPIFRCTTDSHAKDDFLLPRVIFLNFSPEVTPLRGPIKDKPSLSPCPSPLTTIRSSIRKIVTSFCSSVPYPHFLENPSVSFLCPLSRKRLSAPSDLVVYFPRFSSRERATFSPSAGLTEFPDASSSFSKDAESV